MSAKNIILGGTLAGLAAGLSGTTVYDEGSEGACGTDFAYCVPVSHMPTSRFYKRTKSSDWAHNDKASRRAYQFCSLGLVPMEMPLLLATDYFRRFSGLVGMPLVASPDDAVSPLCIASAEGLGFILLDPARLMDGLAARCQVRRGWMLARISPTRHILSFLSHGPVEYDRLVSTLPLDKAMALALPNVAHRRTSLALQVLNVGIKLDCPRNGDAHQALFPRGKYSAIDAIDFYSHVDYEAFTPSAPDRSRLALAIKHYVGENEVELTPSSFTARALQELSDFGLIGKVECAEYHYHPGAVPMRNRSDEAVEAVLALEKVGISQVGAIGMSRPMRLDRDLLAGFAAGLSLA